MVLACFEMEFNDFLYFIPSRVLHKKNKTSITFWQVRIMPIINDKELGNFIQDDLKDIVSLAVAITQVDVENISRRLVGRMFFEATKCEELLDSYGAVDNQHWLPLRNSVAMLKAFSRVIYNLFHISLCAPGYNLLDVEGDFEADTKKTIHTLLCSLVAGAQTLVAEAKKNRLDRNLFSLSHYDFIDRPVQGRLQTNRKKKNLQNTEEKAVAIASNFLNIAEKSSFLMAFQEEKPSKYKRCISDKMSEENLRSIADRFHSMQSSYDTYIRCSVLAEKDKKLPTMRGNITLVFHLMDTAVTLIHYYERHINKKNSLMQNTSPFSQKEFLSILMEYFINYAYSYITAIRELCLRIIKDYSVSGEITVPIPFRGFHVRPSTLLAGIARHYGSDAKMFYGTSSFDISNPMDVVRISEEINQKKRESLSSAIMNHKLIKDNPEIKDKQDMEYILRELLFDLKNENKIFLSDNVPTFKDFHFQENESLVDCCVRAIESYTAAKSIQIIGDEYVTIKGDMRVLEDINILVEHHYGEDQSGHNFDLPESLSYLPRQSPPS